MKCIRKKSSLCFCWCHACILHMVDGLDTVILSSSSERTKCITQSVLCPTIEINAPAVFIWIIFKTSNIWPLAQYHAVPHSTIFDDSLWWEHRQRANSTTAGTTITMWSIHSDVCDIAVTRVNRSNKFCRAARNSFPTKLKMKAMHNGRWKRRPHTQWTSWNGQSATKKKLELEKNVLEKRYVQERVPSLLLFFLCGSKWGKKSQLNDCVMLWRII